MSAPGELVYTADEAFTIPANGYVDVAVTASEAGTEYNIDSAKFSLQDFLERVSIQVFMLKQLIL